MRQLKRPDIDDEDFMEVIKILTNDIKEVVLKHTDEKTALLILTDISEKFKRKLLPEKLKEIL